MAAGGSGGGHARGLQERAPGVVPKSLFNPPAIPIVSTKASQLRHSAAAERKLLEGAQGASGGGGGGSRKRAATPGAGQRWAYIGDGGGDVCPCLKLREGDAIFARKGWALHKQLGALLPAAQVCPWEGGQGLAGALLAALGTAPPT